MPRSRSKMEVAEIKLVAASPDTLKEQESVKPRVQESTEKNKVYNNEKLNALHLVVVLFDLTTKLQFATILIGQMLLRLSFKGEAKKGTPLVCHG